MVIVGACWCPHSSPLFVLSIAFTKQVPWRSAFCRIPTSACTRGQRCASACLLVAAHRRCGTHIDPPRCFTGCLSPLRHPRMRTHCATRLRFCAPCPRFSTWAMARPSLGANGCPRGKAVSRRRSRRAALQDGWIPHRGGALSATRGLHSCACSSPRICTRCVCSLALSPSAASYSSVSQKVLSRLHVLAIPHLTNPLLLSDFLTCAIDLGSLLGILALNGLFILMTQHGLEYPSFYVRLYGASLLRPCLRHRLDITLRLCQHCWNLACFTRAIDASSSSC